jgi:hypothetical protein
LIEKWVLRALACAFVLSLVFVAQGPSLRPARAAGVLVPRSYLPFVEQPEPIRYDNFEDQDPAWQYQLSDPMDGSFFHREGRYVGLIDDNSANSITWPGWRPLGDFRLEVDARFSYGEWLNGLGLAFSGNNTWSEYYAYLLAFNFEQHFWSVARVEPGEVFHRLESWAGVPGFVNNQSQWNHLMIERVGHTIRVYCNGRQMPGGQYLDANYGTQRLVGLTVTSFEWNRGEIEFDNFALTPLSKPY